MNSLTEKLPVSIVVDGAEYEINSDFRTSIKFEIMMSNATLPDQGKIISALKLYYKKIPHDITKAVEEMLMFYRGGQGQEENKGSKKGSSKPVYSFDYDSDYIYAAFLAQYGIDLQSIEYLHWWKFKALFQSLNDTNKIVKIMQYRAMEITSSMSKEQKKFYSDMKKQYALPVPKTEKEKISAIEEALLNGGDLSNLS